MELETETEMAELITIGCLECALLDTHCSRVLYSTYPHEHIVPQPAPKLNGLITNHRRRRHCWFHHHRHRHRHNHQWKIATLLPCTTTSDCHLPLPSSPPLLSPHKTNVFGATHVTRATTPDSTHPPYASKAFSFVSLSLAIIARQPKY